uniref:GM03596p n=1 Tax=Drosophila melanogaster TaxID=7227 RepID=Q95SC1_DROME|nr:GM03596p [Drosophila melanogaster]
MRHTYAHTLTPGAGVAACGTFK